MNKEAIILDIQKKDMAIYRRCMQKKEYQQGHIIAREQLIIVFEEIDQRFQNPDKFYYGKYRELFENPCLLLPLEDISEEFLLNGYKHAKLTFLTCYSCIDSKDKEHNIAGSATHFHTGFITLEEIKQLVDSDAKVLSLTNK